MSDHGTAPAVGLPPERPDPSLVEKYEREGFTNLLFWADQVPKDADDDLRTNLAALANDLGIEPARNAGHEEP